MTKQLPRWLPTGTPALISGLLSSGVAYGLHALGIIPGPNAVSDAITPLVGFLVASIVQKPTVGEVISEAKVLADTTLGKLVGREIERRIDEQPAAVKEIVKAAIGIVNSPLPAPPPVIAPQVATVIAQAVAEDRALVEPAPTFLTPPSTNAPHSTE